MTVTIAPAAIDHDELKRIVEVIEAHESEKHEATELVKDMLIEAKHKGFDPKIIRKAVRLRRMDKDDRDEQNTLLDLYMRALGN